MVVERRRAATNHPVDVLTVANVRERDVLRDRDSYGQDGELANLA